VDADAQTAVAPVSADAQVSKRRKSRRSRKSKSKRHSRRHHKKHSRRHSRRRLEVDAQPMNTTMSKQLRVTRLLHQF
jgi:hypothetical protein